MSRAVKYLNHVIKAIASVRAGFFFAFLGTITQMTHTWFISLQFSSFEGSMAILQAATMSIFLSGGLLFYIVRTGSAEDFKARKKYNRIANAFMVFEIFINLFYWIQKIVFIPWFVQDQVSSIAWYELIIAVPFSVLIPVILKTYGGEISLAELAEEERQKNTKEVEKKLKDFKNNPQRMKILSVDSDNKEYKVEFK
jgi:hypothetical protein